MATTYTLETTLARPRQSGDKNWQETEKGWDIGTTLDHEGREQ